MDEILSHAVIRIVKTFHLNGNLSEEYATMNGVKHGCYKSWYQNGVLASEANYFNGIKTGFCADWMPDGKLSQIYHCENNYIVGDYIQFHEEDGSISSHYKFNEKGHIHGLDKRYCNDRIVMMTDYDDGIAKKHIEFDK